MIVFYCKKKKNKYNKRVQIFQDFVVMALNY